MDIRENIRSKLCTKTHGKYYFSVNNKTKVRMYLEEEARSGNMANLPFISLAAVSAPIGVHNVGGDRRYEEQYIDVHFWAVQNRIVYVDAAARAFIDRIRANTKTIDECHFVHETGVIDADIIENEKIICYHRIVTLHAERYM
jgi:hypothetical protein